MPGTLGDLALKEVSFAQNSQRDETHCFNHFLIMVLNAEPQLSGQSRELP